MKKVVVFLVLVGVAVCLGDLEDILERNYRACITQSCVVCCFGIVELLFLRL